jgi:hypothetical protein
MLLVAEGLFRLDVAISGDTLRTFVRNLSSGQLQMHSGPAEPNAASVVVGEAAAYEPARASVEFSLGVAGDRVDVHTTIGTLRFAQRGTVKVSAQAIVRQARGRR